MLRPLAVAAFIAVVAPPTLAAEWKPGAYASESTLELRTTAPGEGDHWFPVWLVVFDDQVYVRLGTRAAGRIERNTTKPYVGVRVAGQQFDRIKAVVAPESVERVARAMADKYWSDVLVRHMDHPLTMRLAPE
jgi:hypothetical protein